MNNRLLKFIQAAPILHIVATHGNFSKAAEVMGVHQTAVSHRIKALEDMLGFQLFTRTTRSLTLTTEGRILCDASSASVYDLEKAYDRAHEARNHDTIRLSTISSLAVKWLLPLMGRTTETRPMIDLLIEERLVDLHKGEADVAIRFGTGPYPGLHATRLIDVFIQPVANPAYIKENNIKPGCLENQEYNLLIDKISESMNLHQNWDHYFDLQNRLKGPHNLCHYFERSDLTLQAAMSGLGVAMGRTLLIEEELERGFLTVLDKPIQIKPSYWLLTLPHYAKTDKFQKLKEIILNDINLMRRKPPNI